MKRLSQTSSVHRRLVLLASVVLLAVDWPMTVVAQDGTTAKDADAKLAASKSPIADQSLADQLRELQIKVAKLEGALKQKHGNKMSAGMQGGSMSGMGTMGGKKEMMGGQEMGGKMMSGKKEMMGGQGMGGKMMGGKKEMMSGQEMGGKMMAGKKEMMSEQEMGGKTMGGKKAMMSGQEMGGKTMGGKKEMMSGQEMGGKMMAGKKAMMSEQEMGGKGMSGMAMMGRMKGMGQMRMPSALPGFAGASHIYHIGATGFFLDHSQHITLTQEQQVKLNQIKEKILLGQATFDRRISQAEQELWVLTGSDVPNAAKIEAKIREIEKLNGDKRIAYIRAVGEAAGVITDEQRQTLVGNLPADHKAMSGGNQN